jgi:hypothetical protein
MMRAAGSGFAQNATARDLQYAESDFKVDFVFVDAPAEPSRSVTIDEGRSTASTLLREVMA